MSLFNKSIEHDKHFQANYIWISKASDYKPARSHPYIIGSSHTIFATFIVTDLPGAHFVASQIRLYRSFAHHPPLEWPGQATGHKSFYDLLKHHGRSARSTASTMEEKTSPDKIYSLPTREHSSTWVRCRPIHSQQSMRCSSAVHTTFLPSSREKGGRALLCRRGAKMLSKYDNAPVISIWFWFEIHNSLVRRVTFYPHKKCGWNTVKIQMCCKDIMQFHWFHWKRKQWNRSTIRGCMPYNILTCMSTTCYSA